MTTQEQIDLFFKVDRLVRDKYFDPKFNGKNWPALVEKHRSRIEGAGTDEVFEAEVNSLLHLLGTSHTHFFNPRRSRIPSRSSINATFKAVTVDGTARWVFQDVQPGGPADRAGIQPGDVLVSLNKQPIAPPEEPDFRMASSAAISVIHRNGEPRELLFNVAIPDAKYSEQPYAEPRSVTASILEGGIGYVKVTMFPGKIGIDFAKAVDQAFLSVRPCERLILDLRGNPGGGIGGLRLMSYLTPDKVPVGYSLTRKRSESGYKREDLRTFDGIPRNKWKLPLLVLQFLGRDMSVVVRTEGLGSQPFHGKLAVLVNEHTAGAAEMVTGFVKENQLGKIVGMKTAGRLLGGSGFKVGHGYTLMIPVGCYLSWEGKRYEGDGIEPDVVVDWSAEEVTHGLDSQLQEAIRTVGC